jgi:two-component system LytT family response regulator
MNRIRCIAIDDEPLALRQISGYISKTPYLDLVASCSNAFDAMDVLKREKIELMFVDISMPDLSGMDLVKSLTEKPYTVFTTAFSEYAVDGFKVDAVDYLLKPIGYNDFLKAVNKARDLAEKSGKASQQKEDPDHIFVKSGYKLMRIELSEIKYIESMHEYVRIHLENSKPIMTLASMKAIEELLPAGRFLRVHRSFIVNTSKVNVIERNRIVFDNNVYIPVSDQYKQRFQDFLSRNSLE